MLSTPALTLTRTKYRINVANVKLNLYFLDYELEISIKNKFGFVII